mmetsp:Transcript_46877/g.152063  ORF Transcript_46877/g.152063 Transcript_46877/m.152063 type:complete len:343 (+) Transcript_46877:160-1188(+)
MPLVPRAHQGEALPRQGRLRRGLPGAAPRQDHRPQEDRLRLCQRREPGAAGGVLPAAPLPPRRRPLRGRLSPPARGGRRLRLRRDGVLRRRGPDRPHGVSPRRAAAARGSAGLLPVHAVPHPVLRALLRRAAPRPQARERPPHAGGDGQGDRLRAVAPVPARRRRRLRPLRPPHRHVRLKVVRRARGAERARVRRLRGRRVEPGRIALRDAVGLLPARRGDEQGLALHQDGRGPAARQVDHRPRVRLVQALDGTLEWRGGGAARLAAGHRPGEAVHAAGGAQAPVDGRRAADAARRARQAALAARGEPGQLQCARARRRGRGGPGLEVGHRDGARGAGPARL